MYLKYVMKEMKDSSAARDKERRKEMSLLDSLYRHVIQILLEWRVCTLNAHLQSSSRCFPGGNKRKTVTNGQADAGGAEWAELY